MIPSSSSFPVPLVSIVCFSHLAICRRRIHNATHAFWDNHSKINTGIAIVMKFRKDWSPFPLPTSKMELKGDRFANVGSIKEAIAEKFKNIPETDFSRAVEKLMG